MLLGIDPSGIRFSVFQSNILVRSLFKQRPQIHNRGLPAALQPGRIRGNLQCAMKHHPVVIWITTVPVGLPIRLSYVKFHVARDQAQVLHIQQCVPEIGTGRGPSPARIDHPHPFTGFRAQVGQPGGFLLPEFGQHPLRYLLPCPFGA